MRSTRPQRAERLVLPLRSIPSPRCSHQRFVPSNPTSNSFHTSCNRLARRKPPHKSVSKAEMDRIAAARVKESLPPLSEGDRAAMARRYSPEQLASILAAEEAVSADDMARQAKARKDQTAPTHIDDFARIRPIIDSKPESIRGEGDNYLGKLARYGFRKLSKPHNDEAIFKAIVRRLVDPENDDGEAQRLLSLETGEDTSRDVPLSTIFKKTGPREGDVAVNENDIDLVTKALRQQIEQDVKDLQQGRVTDPSAIEQQLSSEGPTIEDLVNPPRDTSQVPPSNRSKDKANAPDWSNPDIRLAKLSRYAAEIDAEPHKLKSDLIRLVSPWGNDVDTAQELPMIRDPGVRWDDNVEGELSGADDATVAATERLARTLGQSVEQLGTYRVRRIVMKSVTNQTRLGKIQSVYVLMVAGNEKGMLGLGEGKAIEIEDALRVAKLNAIRRMVPIRRYENRTIYGEVKGKVGAVELTMSTRPPGFGLRISQTIYEMAKCAGLHDLSAKLHRSRNRMNVAKAVWKALQSQKSPEDIARARGRKMVDVRKVYYGGLV